MTSFATEALQELAMKIRTTYVERYVLSFSYDSQVSAQKTSDAFRSAALRLQRLVAASAGPRQLFAAPASPAHNATARCDAASAA